ncbi:hypothetical protein B1A_10122 [mine drainage metagenome]|uniref:Uncharacterized protein n=1 Tax=mine drainage metagenome TaxID=410659 RepID=T1AIY4_9ZZZZ
MKAMAAEYLFFVDLDSSLCVTERKARIRQRFPDLLEREICVVVKEIEGWYLAGMDATFARRLLKLDPARCVAITKEEFYAPLRSSRSRLSRSDLALEALEHYSLADAVQRCASLAYIVDQHFTR